MDRNAEKEEYIKTRDRCSPHLPSWTDTDTVPVRSHTSTPAPYHLESVPVPGIEKVNH